MGIINKDRFVDLLVASKPYNNNDIFGAGLRVEIHRALGVDAIRNTLRGDIDRASALQVYGQIKDYFVQYGYVYGKELRPWAIDKELYKNLDRTKAWWGFEFETGYISHEARGEVISHVWDTWDNIAFDTEGEGNAAVEITFAPCEIDRYRDGTADAIQFIKYMDGNKNVDFDPVRTKVGTHVNISHPKLEAANLDFVVYSMNRTLAALPLKVDGVPDVRMKMFGRSNLYGGFFPNNVGNDVWTEGKLFRTTYKMDVFEQYLKTCEGLSKCLEVLCATPWKSALVDPKFIPYIDNLYEVAFEGAEPVVEWSIHCGTLDGTRDGNRINGAFARPITEKKIAEVAEANKYDDDDNEYFEDDDAYVNDECDDPNCDCHGIVAAARQL